MAACNLADIPEELRVLPQWVVWKADKIPLQARTGEKASVADPATWSTFEEACKAVEQGRAWGVGFVFTGKTYVGIDLDKVIDDEGAVGPEAAEIVKRLDSYTEISQSGRGLHIIVRGHKLGSRSRKSNVEIYDGGRYFAMTGNIYQGKTTIEDRQEQLDWLCETTFEADSQTASSVAGDLLLDPLAEPEGLDAFLKSVRGARTQWEHKSKASDDSMSAYDYRLAMLAAKDGMSDQWIADLIVAHRRKHGDADDRKKALRQDYIRRTINSVRSKSKPLGALGTHLTDTGNAEYLASLCGDMARYDHSRKRWLVWNGTYWQPDRDGYMSRAAVEAARKRYMSASEIEDTELRQKVAKWAIGSENRTRVEACLSLARSIEPFADDGSSWDNDKMLLGCENGIVDLTTGELRSGRPEDRITMSTGLEFDPSAKCPRWELFLSEVFDDNGELIDWLWRALGYSIAGDTSEQIFMVGYGEGANGKSILSAAIANALGDYAHCVPFATFSMPPQSSTNDLAALQGKRFVTSSETNRGAKLNIERIKAISGGDKVTARYLYKEFETYQPHLKLWLFVNHKPDIEDDTIATWRRVRLIAFTQTFIKGKEDKRLAEKLRTESQGILAWLVRGCLEWQKKGLIAPQSVRAATGEYRRETDPLFRFVDECCVRGEDKSILARQLYLKYANWAKPGRPMTQTAFGEIMGKRYHRGREGRTGRTKYCGIGVPSGTCLTVDLGEDGFGE